MICWVFQFLICSFPRQPPILKVANLLKTLSNWLKGRKLVLGQRTWPHSLGENLFTSFRTQSIFFDHCRHFLWLMAQFISVECALLKNLHVHIRKIWSSWLSDFNFYLYWRNGHRSCFLRKCSSINLICSLYNIFHHFNLEK